MRVEIKKLSNSAKKYKAIFYENDTKVKTTRFGATGYSDYTIHKDEKRKQRYLDRHRRNEKWNDYMSAGSLSRFILWGSSTSITENIKSYKKKFNLS